MNPFRCYHPRPEWTWERWQWGVLCIPQSSRSTRTSPYDRLVSYPEHSLGKSYSSAGKQSVNSEIPTDRSRANPEFHKHMLKITKMTSLPTAWIYHCQQESERECITLDCFHIFFARKYSDFLHSLLLSVFIFLLFIF